MTDPAAGRELFLTITALAAFTGLSAKTLDAQAAKETLPLSPLKLGAHYLIRLMSLDDLVRPTLSCGESRLRLPTPLEKR